MTYPRKRINMYCFDTSAFLDLNYIHKRVIGIAKLWDELEKMIHSGQIVSHRLVFDEIINGNKNQDFIAKWIANKRRFFLEITFAQINIVSDIVKKFPKLIDYGAEHEQADPWLIALAIEKSIEQTLFDIRIPVVVSQENNNSSIKIPAVCRCFNIPHKLLKEFFRDIKFTI